MCDFLNKNRFRTQIRLLLIKVKKQSKNWGKKHAFFNVLLITDKIKDSIFIQSNALATKVNLECRPISLKTFGRLVLACLLSLMFDFHFYKKKSSR